jgi:hypothetical protein
MSEQENQADQIPKRTTPTWEIELLISGATVFGLTQLPAPLSRALVIGLNTNEAAIAELMMAGNIYINFAIFTLIITFVLHLLARGYWVALVGMYSVYPKGIIWDKNTSTGPIYLNLNASEMKSVPDLIEKADNRASRIFGFGFGLAMPMIIISVPLAIMVMVLIFVQSMGEDINVWVAASKIIAIILFLPFLLFYFIDYFFGEKLIAKNKDGIIKRVFSLYQRIGFNQFNSPLIYIYTTNEGVKKGTLVMMLCMLPLMGAIGLMIKTQRSTIDNGAYDGLPKNHIGAQKLVRPEYYATSRAQHHTLFLVPYINDSIVQENYLKVFIPYEPHEHNALLTKLCPKALSADAANQGDGLKCLATFFNIQIDGQTINTPLLAGTDPNTGQRGMIAMIDTRELANGQHELKLRAMPKDIESSKANEQHVHRIPFWK